MKKFLVRLWAAFNRYQERRAMYLMLNHLSVKQLQDTGLTKDVIDRLYK
jgi:uncharacterized protein YjiS (DUF1127 family)